MEKQSFSAAKIASALHNSSKGTSSQDSWESEHLAMTGCRQGLLRHCVLAFFRFPTTSLTIFGRFFICPNSRWGFYVIANPAGVKQSFFFCRLDCHGALLLAMTRCPYELLWLCTIRLKEAELPRLMGRWRSSLGRIASPKTCQNK